MLIVARTHFAAGGSQRLQHTLTPLVFSALSVVRRVLGRESAAIAAAALTLSAAGEGGEKAQTDPPVEAVVVPLAFSSRKVTDDFISLLCSVTVACYVYTSLICYEDHHRVV
jgi:hypothetical protein